MTAFIYVGLANIRQYVNEKSTPGAGPSTSDTQEIQGTIDIPAPSSASKFLSVPPNIDNFGKF